MSNVNIKAGERKFPLAEAEKIALEVVGLMEPYCSRIEIGGSIRRRCKYVGDIEIICTPMPFQSGENEDGLAKVVNRWTKVGGNMVYGITKSTQRVLPQGIKVDIFFANPQNWGYIFALRIGSARFSHEILGRAWVRCGYKGIDGYLTKNGQRVEIKEEKDLFRLIGIPYIEPELRNL